MTVSLPPLVLINRLLFKLCWEWDIDHIRLSVDDELQLVTWPAAHANDVVVVTGFNLKLIGNNLRFTGVRRAQVISRLKVTSPFWSSMCVLTSRAPGDRSAGGS